MVEIGWRSWLPIIAMIGVVLIGLAARAHDEMPLTVEEVGRYLDTAGEIAAWRMALPREQAAQETLMPEERAILARHGFDPDGFGQAGLQVMAAFAGMALVPDDHQVLEQRARRAESNPDLTPEQRRQVVDATRRMAGPADAMAAARDRDQAAIAPYLDRLDRLYGLGR